MSSEPRVRRKTAISFKVGIRIIALIVVMLIQVSAGSLYASELRTPNSELRTAVSSPFDALKKTYSGVNSLEAVFHQKIFIAGLKKERTFEGDFFYKRNKGFLWKYRTPKVKFFLYDGKYMWQGEDEKSFVVKERIRKEKTTGTFLDLIDDIARIDELFTLKQHVIAGDLEILEIVPKKDSGVNSAEIWIDKQNIVQKIEIREFTGNVNTIEFSAVKINRGVDDARFIYRPEKGKEIVER
ncbi:MAG: lipoprotein chaperone [Syntrophorhabdus sp. PtaU1.Bin058]|nr:MAG: lipoprotein chaperone [Syntrophorhabdus sp. PtaU1.Bin058]